MTRQVPVQTCSYVAEERVENVPVTTCQMVAEERVEPYEVRTCSMVAEERVENCPVTTCQMVAEERVEPYEVRTCRMVAEERVENMPRHHLPDGRRGAGRALRGPDLPDGRRGAGRELPVTTCQMVAEERTEMVPVTTCRMVAETASRQVPICVPEQVPVTVQPVRRPPGRPPGRRCRPARWSPWSSPSASPAPDGLAILTGGNRAASPGRSGDAAFFATPDVGRADLSGGNHPASTTASQAKQGRSRPEVEQLAARRRDAAHHPETAGTGKGSRLPNPTPAALGENAGRTMEVSPTRKHGRRRHRQSGAGWRWPVMVRAASTARWPCATVQPATSSRVGPGRPTRRVVVPREGGEGHAPVGQPSGERVEVAGGPAAREAGLDQVARDDEAVDRDAAEQRREQAERLARASGRGSESPPEAAGPLVAEVDVGDDRRPLPGVDRRPLGGEPPAVGAVEEAGRGHVGDPRRWPSPAGRAAVAAPRRATRSAPARPAPRGVDPRGGERRGAVERPEPDGRAVRQPGAARRGRRGGRRAPRGGSRGATGGRGRRPSPAGRAAG